MFFSAREAFILILGPVGTMLRVFGKSEGNYLQSVIFEFLAKPAGNIVSWEHYRVPTIELRGHKSSSNQEKKNPQVITETDKSPEDKKKGTAISV